MEREPIDYITFAEKVYAQEAHRIPQEEQSLNFYLMRIVSALGRLATAKPTGIFGEFIDYKLFNDDMKGQNGFNESYEKHIKGTMQDKFAEVAIRIFTLFGVRGIKVSLLDNLSLNMPKMYPHLREFKTINECLFELVATLTHRKEDDVMTLDIIRMSEENPSDEELRKILDEKFGPMEGPEDDEIRTIRGFQNYMTTMPLMTVLNVIASWFKGIGGKDMVWHINVRLFYKAHL